MVYPPGPEASQRGPRRRERAWRAGQALSVSVEVEAADLATVPTPNGARTPLRGWLAEVAAKKLAVSERGAEVGGMSTRGRAFSQRTQRDIVRTLAEAREAPDAVAA